MIKKNTSNRIMTCHKRNACEHSRLPLPSLNGEDNYIITIGTPTYLKKYDNKDPKMGHAVAAEMDLVNQRLTGSEAEKATILPILRNGSEKTSLPPLLVKKVYADFRKDEFYFLSLFKLLLTIHKVPFTHPGVIDLLTKLEPKQFG